MPARRRTATSSIISGNSGTGDEQDNNDDYHKKRKRNNDAVRKTREKSKHDAEARKQNVEKLRRRNQHLEGQIVQEQQHIATLKDLLVKREKTADQEKMVEQILAERTDDEEDSIGAMTPTGDDGD